MFIVCFYYHEGHEDNEGKSIERFQNPLGTSIKITSINGSHALRGNLDGDALASPSRRAARDAFPRGAWERCDHLFIQ
ncbi:MAG: hypothetical protein CVV06_01485 [Gammaproteobacteria bacterium HGW-Gammaproteobacteria-10]|nr:MAG: hypothetical protein CVV06_01485 [Gammaproteobacteria bacterium HGW-Gammaproteobacteria-10]